MRAERARRERAAMPAARVSKGLKCAGWGCEKGDRKGYNGREDREGQYTHR